MNVAVKSPCRGCELEHADKRNPTCRDCDKRVEFCVALGGMTHSVPERDAGVRDAGVRDVKTHTQVRPMEEETMTEVQAEYAGLTKICSRPSCEHGGTPQALDNFHRATKGKYGRQSECKDCRRILAQKAFKNKRQGVKKEVKREEKISSVNTANVIIPKDGQHLLTLDFSGFPTILEKIKTTAGEELRTVEMQALYILRLGVGI